MARTSYNKLPIEDLKQAEKYLIAETQSLLALKGSPWIFVGMATMIDYLARFESGKVSSRKAYVGLIRKHFPKGYSQFKYKIAHRKAGTGQPIIRERMIEGRKVKRVVGHEPKVETRMDLPEQMYFIFRCGLVHAYSLVPSLAERRNGGRRRSITIHSKKDSQKDGKKHLDKYERLPDIEDAAYFVDEVLLDDLIAAIKKVFADKNNHANIRKMLKRQPPISPF